LLSKKVKKILKIKVLKTPLVMMTLDFGGQLVVMIVYGCGLFLENSFA